MEACGKQAGRIGPAPVATAIRRSPATATHDGCDERDRRDDAQRRSDGRIDPEVKGKRERNRSKRCRLAETLGEADGPFLPSRHRRIGCGALRDHARRATAIKARTAAHALHPSV
jgi:hypothetical protein